MGKLEMIIEGGAKGADTLGKEVAKALCIPYLEFTANWAIYNRAAGPIRNKRMLVEGKPDIIIAFHDNIRKSKGTKDMVKQATEMKVPVVVIGRVNRK